MAKRIAPRLANGQSRARCYSALPPYIKDGLKLMAARERSSVSWMLERFIVNSLFQHRLPKYQTSKPKLHVVRRRSKAS